MKKESTRPDPPLKRIVLEMSAVRNRNVGVGEFCHQLALRYAAKAKELKASYGIQLCFIVPNRMEGLYGDDIEYYPLKKRLYRHLLRLWPRKNDLFHAMHQFSAVKYMQFARNNLMTVHDINFMAEKRGTTLNWYARSFRNKVRKVDYLSFISRFSQDDVERHFGIAKPARVIYNGVTDLRGEPPCDLSRWNLPPSYLFHISSLQPKKNPKLLIEMMRCLPEKHLVIAGNWKTPYAETLKSRIAELGLRNVTCLHHVTNGEKASLYAGCEGFLFPSLCEGFGLPPLEAMLMGKPAFLSALTSLPEVGGPHAYYWDELDPTRMAERVTAGLQDFYLDPKKAAAVSEWASQFNWDTCAQEYIDYYLEILGLK